MRAHLERGTDPLLTLGLVAALLRDGADGFFDVDLEAEAQRRLRRACRSGRPLGAADWVKALNRVV